MEGGRAEEGQGRRRKDYKRWYYERGGAASNLARDLVLLYE